MPVKNSFAQKALNNRIKKVFQYILSEILFEYQRRYILDQHRFKIVKKARQIGISLMLGLEGWLDVFAGTPVFYVSRSMRQSVYLLDKFYKWGEFFKRCGIPIEYETHTQTHCKINGVNIVSLTSNAVTGEGFSGNVYLDEFALHDDDEQIYTSLYPTITWGYNIRIISRTFGNSNKFYQIYTDKEKYPDFHRFSIDIYQAIKDGLPVIAEDLKRNFDKDSWKEMYEAIFLDEATAYFTYELIKSCSEIHSKDENFKSDIFIGDNYDGIKIDSKGELKTIVSNVDGAVNFMGVDIGRSRDLTSITILNFANGKCKMKELTTLEKQPFSIQHEIIYNSYKRNKCLGGYIDKGLIGYQLAEDLEKKISSLKGISFGTENKIEMATDLKKTFEQENILIFDDEDLYDDIHSIKKTISSSNTAKFDAPHGEIGHADRFWSIGLARKCYNDFSKSVIRITDINESIKKKKEKEEAEQKVKT